MTDWKTFAKSNVPSRDWSRIRLAWTTAAIGFEYGTVSSLEDSIDELVGENLAELTETTVTCH